MLNTQFLWCLLAKSGHRPSMIKHDGLKVEGGIFDARPSYSG